MADDTNNELANLLSAQHPVSPAERDLENRNRKLRQQRAMPDPDNSVLAEILAGGGIGSDARFPLLVRRMTPRRLTPPHVTHVGETMRKAPVMATLRNARHEIFAQEIVKGVSGREAYKIAGFVVSNDNAADASASRLLRDVKVQARIAELQEKAQARALITLEEHIEELKAIRNLAKKNGQASAAVAAEVKRGELMGYYVERRESTNTNYNISDKPLNEDDWERQYGVGVPGSSHGKNH